MKRSSLRIAKWTALLAGTLGGGTLTASCGMTDVKDMVVAGTLNAVKISAGEFWEALLPTWDEVLKAQN